MRGRASDCVILLPLVPRGFLPGLSEKVYLEIAVRVDVAVLLFSILVFDSMWLITLTFVSF